jgi:hypothetical protein
LHLISIKGRKNKRTAIANVTAEGILVPNIPGAAGAGAYTGCGGGWLVSIMANFKKDKET